MCFFLFFVFKVVSTPNVGLELMILRSRVACSTHWTSQGPPEVIIFTVNRNLALRGHLGSSVGWASDTQVQLRSWSTGSTGSCDSGSWDPVAPHSAWSLLAILFLSLSLCPCPHARVHTCSLCLLKKLALRIKRELETLLLKMMHSNFLPTRWRGRC